MHVYSPIEIYHRYAPKLRIKMSETKEKRTSVTFKGLILRWIEKNIASKRFRNIQHAVEYCISELMERERFEHYNVYEDHATIVDHKLDKWIDIYFRGDKPYCEFCEEFDCEHIRFLLQKEEFREILKAKGFRI